VADLAVFQSVDSTVVNESECSSVFSIDGTKGLLTDAEMRQLSPMNLQNLQEKIYQNASEGSGFLYGRNNVTGQHHDAGPGLLSEFADLLNAETMRRNTTL